MDGINYYLTRTGVSGRLRIFLTLPNLFLDCIIYANCKQFLGAGMVFSDAEMVKVPSAANLTTRFARVRLAECRSAGRVRPLRNPHR